MATEKKPAEKKSFFEEFEAPYRKAMQAEDAENKKHAKENGKLKKGEGMEWPSDDKHLNVPKK
jgi:hypothetical protein